MTSLAPVIVLGTLLLSGLLAVCVAIVRLTERVSDYPVLIARRLPDDALYASLPEEQFLPTGTWIGAYSRKEDKVARIRGIDIRA